MKIAVIDIGTNTSRLAVFSVSAEGVKRLDIERNVITRLGEGLRPGGALSRAAAERTLYVIKDFVNVCREAGVDRIAAAGTAALRNAADGSAFLLEAKQHGLDVEIITGTAEGELVFRGVVSGLEDVPDDLLILDIGGGSTEFVRGKKGVITGCASVALGAVSGTERFFKCDPPTAGERSVFYKYCGEVAGAVIEESPSEKGMRCVGVAGVVTTLGMMDLGLAEYDAEKVNMHKISSESISALADKLMAMNSLQRRAVPGMQPGRADIIHCGAAILNTIVRLADVDEITVSERDIRHGLLEREIKVIGGPRNSI